MAHLAAELTQRPPKLERRSIKLPRFLTQLYQNATLVIKIIKMPLILYTTQNVRFVHKFPPKATIPSYTTRLGQGKPRYSCVP